MMADGSGVGGAHEVAATDWSDTGMAPMEGVQEKESGNKGTQKNTAWGRMEAWCLASLLLCWVGPCLHALAILGCGLVGGGICIGKQGDGFVRDSLHSAGILKEILRGGLREGWGGVGEGGGWWCLVGVLVVMVAVGGGCGWWWWK